MIKTEGLEGLMSDFNKLSRSFPQGIVSPSLAKAMRLIVRSQKAILRRWGQSRTRTGKRRTNKLATLLKARKSKSFRIVSWYSSLPSRDALDSKGIGGRGYLPSVLEYGFKHRKTTKTPFNAPKFLRTGFDQEKARAIRELDGFVDKGIRKRLEKRGRI